MSAVLWVALIVYIIGVIAMFSYIIWTMKHNENGQKKEENIEFRDILVAFVMAGIWPVTLFIFLD